MQVMMELPDHALRGVLTSSNRASALLSAARKRLWPSRGRSVPRGATVVSRSIRARMTEELQSKYVAYYGAMGDAIARIAPHLEAVTQFQVVWSRATVMKRTANVLTTLCRACREERGYVEIRSKQARLAYVLRLREQNYSGEIKLHSWEVVAEDGLP